jgi:hypothetical protein
MTIRLSDCGAPAPPGHPGRRGALHQPRRGPGRRGLGPLASLNDETLRSLFAGHGGEEANRIGDGFFVAFEGSNTAADCGKAIQQALARHRQEYGFSPQVGIGIHEVEATRKGNDYQGKGVHLAARIGALAAGGEILASRSAADHGATGFVESPHRQAEGPLGTGRGDDQGLAGAPSLRVANRYESRTRRRTMSSSSSLRGA